MSSAHRAPLESETRPAAGVSVSSMTARQSAAKTSSAYAAGPSGRSESPLPRPSIASTRECRARYGIWHFQNRESTIDHVGRRNTV